MDARGCVGAAAQGIGARNARLALLDANVALGKVDEHAVGRVVDLAHLRNARGEWVQLEREADARRRAGAARAPRIASAARTSIVSESRLGDSPNFSWNCSMVISSSSSSTLYFLRGQESVR